MLYTWTIIFFRYKGIRRHYSLPAGVEPAHAQGSNQNGFDLKIALVILPSKYDISNYLFYFCNYMIYCSDNGGYLMSESYEHE